MSLGASSQHFWDDCDPGFYEEWLDIAYRETVTAAERSAADRLVHQRRDREQIAAAGDAGRKLMAESSRRPADARDGPRRRVGRDAEVRLHAGRRPVALSNGVRTITESASSDHGGNDRSRCGDGLQRAL